MLTVRQIPHVPPLCFFKCHNSITHRASTSAGTSEKQWQNRPGPAFPIVAPPFVTEGDMGHLTSVVSFPNTAAGSISAPPRRREPRASRSLPPLGGGEIARLATPEGPEAESAPARVEGRGGVGQGLRDKYCASRGVVLRALEEGVRWSPDRVARLSGLSQGVASGEGGCIPSYGKRKVSWFRWFGGEQESRRRRIHAIHKARTERAWGWGEGGC